jgi:hypothetical protein
MALQPILIVQVPRGGGVHRQLEARALPSMESGKVVVEAGPTDAMGNLEASAAGQVVLSLPSPEALEQEAGQVRRVIAHAGTGIEPLVVELEAAEELRENELAALLDATSHASRAVILRIVRDATLAA